jgi:hypothetical protein
MFYHKIERIIAHNFLHNKECAIFVFEVRFFVAFAKKALTSKEKGEGRKGGIFYKIIACHRYDLFFTFFRLSKALVVEPLTVFFATD